MCGKCGAIDIGLDALGYMDRNGNQDKGGVPTEQELERALGYYPEAKVEILIASISLMSHGATNVQQICDFVSGLARVVDRVAV